MPKASRAPADTLPWSLRLDWDDLRHVLVIAQAGSLKAASEALGVQHSTVLRRLDALEQRLGARLFDRQRQGCVPTEAGELLLAEAQRLPAGLDEAARRIQGRDLQLNGSVRLNTGHVLMQYLLPPALASFARAHPGIEVAVREDALLVDLSRRDADVVLRMSARVPEHLVGRQVGAAAFRIYALRGERALPQELWPLERLAREARWVSDARVFERLLRMLPQPPHVALRTDLIHSVHAMLHTGLGVGLLPAFVGDVDPRLIAVSAPINALRTPLWLLTHPDLRRTARIKAFLQHVGDALQARLAALGPPLPPAGS